MELGVGGDAVTAGRATLARLVSGALDGATHLDLRHAGLAELPPEVMALADTLEVLDVSGNALQSLPDALDRCTRLHTFFASQNRFTVLPPVLGRLPRLDTLGFKANLLAEVPADALAPSLRWLILTDNRLAALPRTLTACTALQKLMLAGNRLTQLPSGLSGLARLELLRLSANRFGRVQDALPDELLALPRLAWLAHAGNPFSAAREAAASAQAVQVPWAELQLGAVLGEGASGQVLAATWQAPGERARAVAVKRFKGAVTSDGLPASEMAATLAAGAHPGLVGAIGAIAGHPDGTPGLVMPRLPPGWAPLASPPSMASCTRDVYAEGFRLTRDHARAITHTAASVLDHLHGRGLVHGDLYAHNLLVDGRGGARLSDFGAASFLPSDDAPLADALRAIDRRAWQVLADEVATRAVGD